MGSLERFIGILTEHLAGKWCVPPLSQVSSFCTFRRHFILFCVRSQALLDLAETGDGHPRWGQIRSSPSLPLFHYLQLIPCLFIPQNAYAHEVSKRLHKAKFHVEVDDSGETLNKKIRNAEIGQWNFTLGSFSPLSSPFAKKKWPC